MMTGSSASIFTVISGSRSFSGMTCEKLKMARRRDMPPLRSLKVMALLLMTRIGVEYGDLRLRLIAR